MPSSSATEIPRLLIEHLNRGDCVLFVGDVLDGEGAQSARLARVGPSLEEPSYRLAYARMLGDPAAEVKAAVRGVPVSQLASDDRDRNVHDVLVGALPPAGRLVMVLDQFEEFFLRQGEAVRRAFVRELADCLGRGSQIDRVDRTISAHLLGAQTY